MIQIISLPPEHRRVNGVAADFAVLRMQHDRLHRAAGTIALVEGIGVGRWQDAGAAGGGMAEMMPMPYMPCLECGHKEFRIPLEHDKQGIVAECLKCGSQQELYDGNEDAVVLHGAAAEVWLRMRRLASILILLCLIAASIYLLRLAQTKATPTHGAPQVSCLDKIGRAIGICERVRQDI
jgi:hypothetical protein